MERLSGLCENEKSVNEYFSSNRAPDDWGHGVHRSFLSFPIMSSIINGNGRICVLIDAANLESGVKRLGWHIDYRKLRSLFAIEQLMHLRYYSVRHLTQNQIKFFVFLKRAGYTLITKPLKIIKEATVFEGEIRKANFDVEISVDAISFHSEYDTLVLFSGDSDFDYLIKQLRKVGKKALVISSKNNISRELIETCDRYIDLKDLRGQIERAEINKTRL